jgi:hypothetical protein
MPTITEILQQVHDLVLSPADAEPLIQQHLAAATDRAACARAALTGYLAKGANFGSATVLAERCMEHADALLAAAGAQP